MKPVVLYVRHGGIPKMVGKVLSNGIFYHAATPSQYHYKTECSYPLDTVLVEYLYKNKVETIHCGRKGSKKVLATSPIEASNGEVKDWGNRYRHYLSDSEWTETVRDYDDEYVVAKVVLEGE